MKIVAQKNLYFAFLVLTLFSLFSGCKKEEEGACPGSGNLYFSNYYSGFLFKPGTYWISKDSLTGGNFDSTIVFSDSSWMMPKLHSACPGAYQAYKFKTKTFPTMRIAEYTVIANQYLLQDTLSSGYQRYYGDVATHGLSAYVHNGDTLGNFSPGFYFLFKQHASVNGITYSNVEIGHIASDPFENGKKCIYYFNSDYFLLKKEVYTGSTLTEKRVLVSSHIVR